MSLLIAGIVLLLLIEVPMKRVVCLIFAYLFLLLALIGVVIPGLPTVPFLLLATWFAARGSAKLHAWLYAHPKLGAVLIDWEREGAVSKSSKCIAIVAMSASWLFLTTRFDSYWLLAGLALLFICVSAFLITRPVPKR